MSQRVPVIVGKKSDAQAAPAESVERLLNAYLESVPTGKEPMPIYGTPGLKLWADQLSGGIRGGLEMRGTVYAVMGAILYSFDVTGAATVLGAIPNTDDVAMAEDGTNVVVVTAGAIYVWNFSDGLNLVTDPDAPEASSVTWSDSYFIFGELGTETYFISGLADPIDYDALDFASAEANPDLLVTPLAHHRILYMFGTESIEAQQNTGGAAFPFSRYEGLNIDVGLAGRDAVISTNDSMFWLADDDTFRRMDGITATKISTARISKLVKGWADQSLTIATAHVYADHLFVVFRNPDGCVVWDQNAEAWHERGSYSSPTWRTKHMIRAYGLLLFGSADEGKIYSLDADTYDEDGQPLPFRVVTPYVYSKNQRLTVGELEVVIQSGVGTLTLDPKITLRRTKNGKDWSPRKLRGMGKVGQNDVTPKFGMQGQARAMAFEIGIDDPVQRAVLGIYADIDVET